MSALSTYFLLLLGSILINCQDPDIYTSTKGNVEIICYSGPCVGLVVYYGGSGTLRIKCVCSGCCDGIKVYCGNFDPPGSQYDDTDMLGTGSCFIIGDDEMGNVINSELYCKGLHIVQCRMSEFIQDAVVQCDTTAQCGFDCSGGCIGDNELHCQSGLNCNCINNAVDCAAVTVISTTAPTTALTTMPPTSALSPTTMMPTTATPTVTTTIPPTTNSPTTNAPTTNIPTTNILTTDIPTTNIPTISAPTTNIPTTSAPTSKFPTFTPTFNVFSTSLTPTIAMLPSKSTLTSTEISQNTTTSFVESPAVISVPDDNDMEGFNILFLLLCVIAVLCLCVLIGLCFYIYYRYKLDKHFETVKMTNESMQLTATVNVASVTIPGMVIPVNSRHEAAIRGGRLINDYDMAQLQHKVIDGEDDDDMEEMYENVITPQISLETPDQKTRDQNTPQQIQTRKPKTRQQSETGSV